MALFRKDHPYQHIVDFIASVVESDDLATWVQNLADKPDYLRLLELAEMKGKMENNHEPEEYIEVVELLSNSEILHATNKVIYDLRSSGVEIKKYVSNKDNNNFKTLITLVAATT